MSVRAKFRVRTVTHDAEGTAHIALFAVTGGTEENESFFAYTPSGDITLGTVNPAAAEQFHEGEEFYVDFTPAS